MMIRKISISILFLSIPLASFGDYLRPYPRSPKRSLVFLNAETQIYYSQFNFLETGEFDYLNENKPFITFLNYNLEVTYHPYSWLKLTPHLQAKTFYNSLSPQAESVIFIPFHPTEVGGALSFPFRFKKMAAFQSTFKFSFPLDNQNGNIQRIVLSDETMTLSAESLFQLYIQKRFIPFVRSRILYRGKELLTLIQGQVGLKYRDRIWEVGGLIGAQDSLAFNNQIPSDKSHLLTKFNSNSLKFFSLAPLTLGFSTWIDIQLSPLSRLFAQYGMDLYGKGYAKGHQVTLGLRVRIVKKTNKKSFRKHKNNFQEKIHSIESLLEDDSDQELMKEIENLQ